MPQNILGEFAQETARTVSEHGERIARIETMLNNAITEREKCYNQHTKCIEELGKLAHEIQGTVEAHIVEHKVNAATLDRSSKNFVAIVAGIAVVFAAFAPKLVELLF